MSVLNFLLKNLQGCCLLFNYQGSFSLLSSQRQLIYIITFAIACQQLFYFSFSLSVPFISVVRNSLSRISFLSTFVNRKFHLFFAFPWALKHFPVLSHATACIYYHSMSWIVNIIFIFFIMRIVRLIPLFFFCKDNAKRTQNFHACMKKLCWDAAYLL